MNNWLGQVGYTLGQLKNQQTELITGPLGIFLGCGSYVAFGAGGWGIPLGICLGYYSIKNLFYTGLTVRSRIKLKASVGKIESMPKGTYPIEDAEKVIIKDRNGLEMLLEKAMRKEKKEWQAMYRIHSLEDSVVIEDIQELDGKIYQEIKLPFFLNHFIAVRKKHHDNERLPFK